MHIVVRAVPAWLDAKLRGGVPAADHEDPLPVVPHAVEEVARVQHARVPGDPRDLRIAGHGGASRGDHEEPAGDLDAPLTPTANPRRPPRADDLGALGDLDALIAREGIHVAQEILAGREGPPHTGEGPDRPLQGQGGPVGAGDPRGEKNHSGAHVAPRLSDLPPFEDLVRDPVLPEVVRQEDSGRPPRR